MHEWKMNAWINEYKNGWINEKKNARKDECLNNRIQGLMNAWMKVYKDIECMN